VKKDLDHLPPKEAREILALAAMAVRARQAQYPPRMILVHLDGPVTDEALREAARGLLEEKRRASGMEHVDLVQLRVG
jgi:DNA-directed RNA polymerase subunit K/omega